LTCKAVICHKGLERCRGHSGGCAAFYLLTNSGWAGWCCPVHTELPLNYADRLGDSANAIFYLRPCFGLDLRSSRGARMVFPNQLGARRMLPAAVWAFGARDGGLPSKPWTSFYPDAPCRLESFCSTRSDRPHRPVSYAS